MQKPRWEDEELKFTSPDVNQIVCKDCVFRLKDGNFRGQIIYGAAKGECDVFPIKPITVLFDGEQCEYYFSEKDAEQ